jgi:hypothetical protein
VSPHPPWLELQAPSASGRDEAREHAVTRPPDAARRDECPTTGGSAGRRALLIGVRHFPAAPRGAETPAGSGHRWHELSFAHDRVTELADALRMLHYRIGTVLDPSADALLIRVQEHFGESGGPSIIHIVSHGDGDVTQPDRLDLVPSCGRVGVGTNVAEWVSTAQRLGKPTLFLVDLCQAGRTARPPWSDSVYDRDVNAWVIAAAWRDEDAYDGRFSAAVARVLRRCAVDGLGTAPHYRYVSFTRLAQCIGDELGRSGGPPQTVTATRVDPAQGVEIPFVPNPNWTGDAHDLAWAGIDGVLRGFVDDEIADARHFTVRAGRYFTGRTSQLAQLAPWFDGDDGAGSLRLVTGSPGAGKSALLGVLVCAAHPSLIAAVPEVRARLAATPAACPSPNPRLAAVHARQRTLGELVASTARQLGLPATEDSAALIAEVCAMTDQPVLVVDALDEAVHPDDVQAVLLLPLHAARRPDGRAACRLVVGVRPWWDVFDPLRRAAHAGAGVVDLDEVEPEVLKEDLRRYLLCVLADRPGYRGGEQRLVRQRLADEIAARLTAPHAGEAEGQRWGAFLVAEVYGRHLARATPADTLAAATTLGAAVPTDLPHMLELELGGHHVNPVRLRAVLAALAFAKGDGMPADLVAAVACALAPGGIAARQAVAVLAKEARFYIRASVELDATARYRLFHQGLADYLRRFPDAPPGDPR